MTMRDMVDATNETYESFRLQYGEAPMLNHTQQQFQIELSSGLVFLCLGFIVRSQSEKLKRFLELGPLKQALWVNTAVSFIHSTFISVSLLVLLATAPQLFVSNYIYGNHVGALIVLASSTGYFAYDLYDMIQSGVAKGSPILVLHHLVVIVCYNLSLYYTIGVPYLILTLLCEFNSIFLHARKLLSMYGLNLNSLVYQCVWAAQWITFISTRLIPHAVITYVVFSEPQTAWPQKWMWYVAFFGILVFNFLNVGLMHQLWGVFMKEVQTLKKA